jgi:hypothetical protein
VSLANRDCSMSATNTCCTQRPRRPAAIPVGAALFAGGGALFGAAIGATAHGGAVGNRPASLGRLEMSPVRRRLM